MKRQLPVWAVLTVLIAGIYATPDLAAWGDEGHRMVCGIAYKLLSLHDRKEVNRLTRLYRTPEHGSYQNFTDACTFPDLARRKARSQNPSVKELWKHFAPFSQWHYLNLPRTAHVVDPQLCADDCVLHGIAHHLEQFKNHALLDPERAEALFFLGHWVGDIHQPLHISFADDSGGNDIKPISGLYAPLDNLHSVWDSGIAGQTHPGIDWWTFAGTLRSRITPQLRQQWTAVPVKDWAQESYDITIREATKYCVWSGTECRSIVPNGRHLTSTYQTTFGPVVELRLEQAGARLAALIEQGLHP